MLTHNEVSRKQRPWGFEVREVVWEGSDHIETFTISWRNQFRIPTEANIANRIAQRLQKIQERLIWNINRADKFDGLDDSIKESLIWLVKKIRANPNATVTQARTVWDTEMSDELFDFDKLATRLRRFVGVSTTWNQFKTYVINKKFEGVD